MNGTNRVIRHHLRAERWKRAGYWLIGLAFAVLLAWATVRSTGETVELEGVVARLIAEPSDTGDLHYLIVVLDDDRTVRVRVPGPAEYRQGKVVRLLATPRRYSSGTDYRFDGYVEADG